MVAGESELDEEGFGDGDLTFLAELDDVHASFYQIPASRIKVFVYGRLYTINKIYYDKTTLS